MKYKYLPVILILLSMPTLTGCFGVDNDFLETKSIVMNSMNNRFYKDIEFSVGSAGLSLARLIVSFNDDNEDASLILNNISRVQVGIYKRTHNNSQDYNFSFFNELDKKMKEDNWQYVVKHIEGDELTGVYVKYHGNEINKMYVINIEREELHLVRVEGDLQNILAYAIKDKGFDKVTFK